MKGCRYHAQDIAAPTKRGKPGAKCQTREQVHAFPLWMNRDNFLFQLYSWWFSVCWWQHLVLGQLRNYLFLEFNTCMLPHYTTCVLEKMETAAIFHVVHSKVTSIVSFVMKVTSRARIVGKKPVARVWRKHLRFTECMHAPNVACSSLDKFVSRLVAWIHTSVCSQGCQLSKYCRDSKMGGACKAASCLSSGSGSLSCGVAGFLLATGDMESSTAVRILLPVSRHVIVTTWPIARSAIGFLHVTSVSLVIAVVMCRLLDFSHIIRVKKPLSNKKARLSYAETKIYAVCR